MKKFLLVCLVVLATNAYAAKKVTVCQYFASLYKPLTASKILECTGDFEGDINIVDLYKKGWSLIGVVAEETILIFEK